MIKVKTEEGFKKRKKSRYFLMSWFYPSDGSTFSV